MLVAIGGGGCQGDENCGGGREVCGGLKVMCVCMCIYRMKTLQGRERTVKKMATYVTLCYCTVSFNIDLYLWQYIIDLCSLTIKNSFNCKTILISGVQNAY